MKRLSTMSKAQIARAAANAGVPAASAAAHLAGARPVPRDATAKELLYAHRIIGVMLGAMTIDQKVACAKQLEAEGVSPDGMTRYHERLAALKSAGAA
jgi:hypothetical protein